MAAAVLCLWWLAPWAHAQSSCPSAPPTGAVQWTQQWCDEFDSPAGTPIDAAKWQFEKGNLGVNNEIEYYCAPSDGSPCDPANPNAFLDGNGHLVIQALRLNDNVTAGSNSWTSARLNTANNLASFQYGRIESNMQLSAGAGIWPAFWALGTNIATVGWPSSGEIDYMENVPITGGLGPNVVRSTIHGPNYSGGNGIHGDLTFPGGGDVTGFHTYGAIWSPYMVQFYVDDPASVFFVATPANLPAGASWVFNNPFFLLLNLAIGGTGSWPGPPDSTTPSPATMTVDYVRVYQAASIAPPTFAAASPLTIKAGASGSAMLNLTGTSGIGLVYLSCSTDTSKASCSIASGNALNAAVVDFRTSGSATATVNVTTLANGASAGTLSLTGGGWLGLGALGLGMILLLSRGAARQKFVYAVALGLAAVSIQAVGCGGGGGGGGQPAVTPPATSATITVNAYTIGSNTGDASTYGTLKIPLTIE